MLTPKSTLDGQVTTTWEESFAERTHGMMSSIIRDLLKMALQPDIISFAGGMPAPELFLVKEFEEACRYVLTHHGARALQYGTTEGYPPLRQYLVEKMEEYDVPAEEDNILVGKTTRHFKCFLGGINNLNPRALCGNNGLDGTHFSGHACHISECRQDKIGLGCD